MGISMSEATPPEVTAPEAVPEALEYLKSGMTLKMAVLSIIFGSIYSMLVVYTAITLLWIPFTAAVLATMLTSGAILWGLNSLGIAKPFTKQELATMGWFASTICFASGSGLISSAIFMCFLGMPESVWKGTKWYGIYHDVIKPFSTWYAWWVCPRWSEIARWNFTGFIPVIILSVILIILARLVSIGIGMQWRHQYVEVYEWPFPTAIARAETAIDLSIECPLDRLKYFFGGAIIALLWGLIIEHLWDYPWGIVWTLTIIGIIAFFCTLSGAFPWDSGISHLPKYLNRWGYYLAYICFIVGPVLGLVAIALKWAGLLARGSFLWYLAHGLYDGPFYEEMKYHRYPIGPDWLVAAYQSSPDWYYLTIDFTDDIVRGGGFGAFAISLKFIFIAIGFLIFIDAALGVFIGSLVAYSLIPAFWAATNPEAWRHATGESIATSVSAMLGPEYAGRAAAHYYIYIMLTFPYYNGAFLSLLICSAILPVILGFIRGIWMARAEAVPVIREGISSLYRGGYRYAMPEEDKEFARKFPLTAYISEKWWPLVMIWLPIVIIAVIALILLLPYLPTFAWIWFFVILIYGLIATPVGSTITAWLIGRCGIYLTNPLPYVYMLMALSTGIRGPTGLYLYVIPTPDITVGPGELQMPLKAAQLTDTKPSSIYWSDIIGQPLGYLITAGIAGLMVAALGWPQVSPAIKYPPGSHWTAHPIVLIGYIWTLMFASGFLGAEKLFPDPWFTIGVTTFVISAWTIFQELLGISIVAPVGIAIGFGLPINQATTIFLGGLFAWILRKLYGAEWFSKYGVSLGAGFFAGTALSIAIKVLIIVLWKMPPHIISWQ